MQLDDRDMAHLWDILDAARAAVKFTEGRSPESMQQDRMLRNAIERNLEIIGEASRRLSEQARATLADVPWRSMIGLRNILAHEYDNIRCEILWSVCFDELPDLIGRLEAFGVDPSGATD